MPSASPSWGLWRLSRLANASPEVSGLFDHGVAAVAGALPAASEPSVVQFAEALDGFLADFGQRGPNEWDIRAVSWEAGPDQVLALVDSMRQMPDQNSPDARHERLEATRKSTAERIRATLADEASQKGFDTAMQSAARMIPLREKTKLIAVTTINEVRMTLRELGRRGVAAGYFAAPEDVMMLLESELDDYVADPARFVPVLAERLAQYRALFELEPPFIIDADPEPLPKWPRRPPRPAGPSRPSRATCCGESAAAPGGTKAGPASAWTCTGRWPWSRAKSSSRRSPTPPGRRCSWWLVRSWWTSAP